MRCLSLRQRLTIFKCVFVSRQQQQQQQQQKQQQQQQQLLMILLNVTENNDSDRANDSKRATCNTLLTQLTR